jgi:hypothetical protein
MRRPAGSGADAGPATDEEAAGDGDPAPTEPAPLPLTTP